MVRPDRTDEEKKVASDHDRSSPELDSKTIGDEAGDTDREDGPTQAAIERIVAHVELFGHVCITGRNHGTPSPNDCGID